MSKGICIFAAAVMLFSATACDSTSSTTPAAAPITTGVQAPATVPGTAVATPAPSATSTEIAIAWSAAQAGYSSWGDIVTTLIEADDPAATGALTQANKTLAAFFAQPVPSDPTKLAQDWPAIQAALVTLQPVINKAIQQLLAK